MVAHPVVASAAVANTVIASTVVTDPAAGSPASSRPVVTTSAVMNTAVSNTVSHAAGSAHPLPGSPGVRPAGRPADPGWGWLRRAAEMAALAGGLPLGGRPGRDRPCYPRIAMRTASLEPGSISAARKFTALIMQRWGAADRSADASVVVSELLSNAVRHGLPRAAAPSAAQAASAPEPCAPLGPGRRGVRLGLLHSGCGVLCAVTDPSAAPPVPRVVGGLDESGRGLHVIAALSDYWGSCPGLPGEAGKVVWATFLTTS